MFSWSADTVRFMADACRRTDFHEKLTALLLPYLKPTDHICDAGCGLGYLSLALSPHAAHITAAERDAAALAVLRQELDERQQDERFAVAYIGDINGSLNDLAIPLRDWINDTAPGLCAQYTFVRNIPQERVVGDSGSLFCVVPRDPNATVAVNRARWNEAKGGYETLEVLYRSESGDPILLFVSNDLGTVPTDTTELLLTDSHPDTLSWYPIPGIVALPYDSENERRLAYDFTFYSQEGNDGFGR